ncbi:uncharacterized protein L201_006155 [Kwoniella dendrophila CBS 6074]|uniref:Metallo-beta-lactamase domain-containing protein n=1 Tax=Kwoniella dendrophila CBS 6074 TaxID=1295534 RepID=A0AAX4K3A2_9TREE
MSDKYTQDDPRFNQFLPTLTPVSLLLSSDVISPTTMLTSFDLGEEKSQIPCHSMLIEKGDEALLSDLGLREDVENFTPFLHNTLLKVFGTASAPHPIAQLKESGYKLDRLKAVIISHKHFDHSILAYTFIVIILGLGSLKSIGPGYPKDPNGQWETSWLEKYKFIELPKVETAGAWSGDIAEVSAEKEKKWERLGCFEHAVDWFGDGSFWLIDAPGHCCGHIMALCRVTTQPDTYVLLAGDAAHHQTMYLPVPTSEGDFRSPKPVINGKVQFAEDPIKATFVVGQLTRMTQEDNVMVILAHEKEVKDVVDYHPNDIAKWKEMGWKEQKERKVTEDAIRRAG